MLTLQALRGEPMCSLPLRGRTLTLYRQGTWWGLFSAFATFVLFNLPWHLVPSVGEILQPLVAAIGFYLSAALMGSLAAHGVDAHSASRRWL